MSGLRCSLGLQVKETTIQLDAREKFGERFWVVIFKVFKTMKLVGSPEDQVWKEKTERAKTEPDVPEG